MRSTPSEQDAAIQLVIEDHSGDYCVNKRSCSETLDVDLVIVASGYKRDVHEDMLRNVRHLMPQGGAEDEKWSVSRNYDVNFKEGAVSDEAGLYLQGCNENTHGLSDTLLSILAVRGGEMVRSLFSGALRDGGAGSAQESEISSNGTKATNIRRDSSTLSGQRRCSPSDPFPVKSADEPSALEMRPSSKNGVCSLMP